MDWQTHVVLSYKILESCGCDKGAAIYSNLPAIDSKPPHYHRVYAHILENQPAILDAAIEIFGSAEVKNHDFGALNRKMSKKLDFLRAKLEINKNDDFDKRNGFERELYAYERLTEEAAVFVDLAEKAADILNDSNAANISTDKVSAGVSLISHTYFDSFNNPIQLFLPNSALCSAQWDFWERIDYMKFRGDFYKSDNISYFRENIIASNIWQDMHLNPKELIKAMIIRLGEMGRPAISYEIIDWGIRKFMRYMEIDEYQRADKALEFCKTLEKEICRLIECKFNKK